MIRSEDDMIYNTYKIKSRELRVFVLERCGV